MLKKCFLILLLQILLCELVSSIKCTGDANREILQNMNQSERRQMKWIMRQLKCNVEYVNPKKHRVAFSEFCEVKMSCTEVASPRSPLKLVRCGKKCVGIRKRKCFEVKAFKYPISVIRKSNNTIVTLSLPVTCHCHKLTNGKQSKKGK